MIAKIDNIPVFNALVSDEETGMFKISLVDDPAVMSNFLAFDNTRKPLLYAIENEEKRLVRGVVMRADFPIYRYDENFGEYYIIYKAETIRQMAEKYLLENRQNDVNLMHEDNSDVDGVQMVQYFIKDTNAGVNPTGFENIADGSLFAEFHIVNDGVWEQVKDGTFKGYSLEGVFDLVPEEDKESVESIVDSLNGMFKKLSKFIHMSKMTKIKAAIAKALTAKFSNVTTDKGILAWDGDEDLKTGDLVYVEDAEGNRTPAEDGDYKTEDGKVIKVADGKVAEITDAEAEVEPVEEENLASVATDGGDLSYEGTLEVGTEVFVTDEEGNQTPAPDGDYKTEDGKTIKVADGKVTEIVEESAEGEDDNTPTDVNARKHSIFSRIATAFAETYEEKRQKIAEALYKLNPDVCGFVWEASDEHVVFCYWGEETGWEDKFIRYSLTWDEAGNPIIGEGVEVKQAFVPVDEPNPTEQVETLSKENADLKKQVAELKNKPLAKPAHEEHESSVKMHKTGDKGLDRLAARFRK